MKLSIISPVYNSEMIIEELVSRITKEVQLITSEYEIILVEDGSADESWEKIETIASKMPRLKGIKLSRNFGQHYAISAGIDIAKGERILILDCDLQDDPVYIHNLISQMDAGYDIVFTERISRKHGLFKSVATSVYGLLFRFFSDKAYSINMGSMVLFSRKVADNYKKLKERDRLYIQVLKWLGFKNTTIKVNHCERYYGTSSYSFLKLISLGLQGWTSHSLKLLKISIYIGFILALISFGLSISVLYKYIYQELLPGWPSIIIAILFSTGLILLSIGIAGIYIGKTFEQSKGRPFYIIEKIAIMHETEN